MDEQNSHNRDVLLDCLKRKALEVTMIDSIKDFLSDLSDSIGCFADGNPFLASAIYTCIGFAVVMFMMNCKVLNFLIEHGF